jgi:hypothetical protein
MSPGVRTTAEFYAAARLEDVSPAWSVGAEDAARESLRRHGLLLLGEMHGVAENAALIAFLVRTLAIERVALEWPARLAAGVLDAAWLQRGEAVARQRRTPERSPDVLAAAVAWFGDGRVTAGHVALIRTAEVVGVEAALGPRDADARDAAMAARLESLPAARTLFVAGNAHTKLERHRHYLPAGAHLARGRPGLCSLDIHYRTGGFYNFGSRRFDRVRAPRGPHLELAVAHEAVVLSV